MWQKSKTDKPYVNDWLGAHRTRVGHWMLNKFGAMCLNQPVYLVRFFRPRFCFGPSRWWRRPAHRADNIPSFNHLLGL